MKNLHITFLIILFSFVTSFAEENASPQNWEAILKYVDICETPEKEMQMHLTNPMAPPEVRWKLDAAYPAEEEIKQIEAQLIHDGYSLRTESPLMIKEFPLNKENWMITNWEDEGTTYSAVQYAGEWEKGGEMIIFYCMYDPYSKGTPTGPLRVSMTHIRKELVDYLKKQRHNQTE